MPLRRAISRWALARGPSQSISRWARLEQESPENSPSGEQIVYSGWADPPDGDRPGESRDLELFIADRDGTNERRLTRLGGWNAFAAFSSDGQRIAFEHREPGRRGAAAVYVMNADGSDLQPITGREAHVGYGGGRPAWQP